MKPAGWRGRLATAIGIILPPLALTALIAQTPAQLGRKLGAGCFYWAAKLQRVLLIPAKTAPSALPPTPQAAEIGALRADIPAAEPDIRGVTPGVREAIAASSTAPRTKSAPADVQARRAAGTDRSQVRSVPSRGILLRRQRVRAAARAGIRPTGSAVGKTSQRPAGVALHNVNALAVGLRDGDVLTHIEGRPVGSPNMVVALAAGALRSGAPAISGEVWRGPHRFLITVELPRLKRSAAPR